MSYRRFAQPRPCEDGDFFYLGKMGGYAAHFPQIAPLYFVAGDFAALCAAKSPASCIIVTGNRRSLWNIPIWDAAG